MSENFPSPEKLKDLPVHGFEGFLKSPRPVIDGRYEVTVKVPHTGRFL